MERIYSLIFCSLMCQLISVQSKEITCQRELTKGMNVSATNCENLIYRTLSGECNNFIDPALGMQFTSLLPANYGDNISSMSLARSGKNLPSARIISYKVFGRLPFPDFKFSLLNMQWGQLVTHDTSSRFPDGAAGMKGLPMKEQLCCSPSGQYEIKNMSTFCFAVPVPENDPVFWNRQCLAFDRSITDKDQEYEGAEDPAPAQQLNGVSQYLDLSVVYGSSDTRSSRLRLFSGGKLRTRDENETWPPQARMPQIICSGGIPGDICYEFGDVRGNQNPGLTSLHILWLHEHNRIARELSALNPHWDDETLFQEARRLNIAQYQHITYYEWNPNFYGTERMLKEGLIYSNHNKGQYVNDYDPCADPRSSQSFQHASFRNFHNQVVGYMQLMSESRRVENGTIRLTTSLNKPGFLEEGCKYSSMIRGLSTQKASLSDSNYDFEVAENFPLGGAISSLDLRTFDVQRGRDHGLPSYNEFREYCGLKRAKCWEDFLDLISYKHLNKLKEIYESFEDVDLSVRGALERNILGSLVGPTFMCINLKQFKDLRTGDRYFFENGEQPYPFTKEQLIEVRKASAARLICNNAEVKYMQPEAFRTISFRNSLQKCSTLPRVDLNKWKKAQE